MISPDRPKFYEERDILAEARIPAFSQATARSLTVSAVSPLGVNAGPSSLGVNWSRSPLSALNHYLVPGFTASRPKLTFRPVVSGRFDLDFQRSDRRRLVFVRFEGLPFPSYRDAAQPLPAVEAGATLSLEALHV